MCAEWRDSFAAFLRDVGPAPSKRHSIDRFPDQNGNYEPGNVRWPLPVEQGNNTRTNRIVKFRGESHTIAEWARLTGLAPHAIHDRIVKLGWPVERALALPRMDRNIYLTLNGVTRTVKEWSEVTGLALRTIKKRRALGWPVERILTAPVEFHRPRL